MWYFNVSFYSDLNLSEMQGKGVLELLKTMSLDELRAFKRWWRQRQTARKTCAYRLFCLIQSGKYEEGQQESLWAKIQPDKAYTPTLLNKYLHQILDEIGKFLVYQRVVENKSRRDLELLKICQEREAWGLFSIRYERMQKEMEEKGEAGLAAYFQRFEMAELKQYYLVKTNPQIRKRNLDEMAHTLDRWWMAQRMLVSLARLTSRQIRNVAVEDRLIQRILPYLDASPELLAQPLIATFRALYAYYTHEPDANAKSLIAVVDQHRPKLTEKERNTVFGLLANAFIPHLNQRGQDDRFLHALEYVYDWGVAEGMLMQGPYMHHQHFKNYISILLRQQKIEQAQLFIDAYGNTLHPDHLDSMKALNQARIDFAGGQFDRVKRKLVAHVFPRMEHQVTATLLRLQVDYEQGMVADSWARDMEEIRLGLDTLRLLIQRHDELTDRHRDPFLNRIELFKKLINTWKPTKLKDLIKEIDSCHPLDDPDWLRAKALHRLENPRLRY